MRTARGGRSFAVSLSLIFLLSVWTAAGATAQDGAGHGAAGHEQVEEADQGHGGEADGGGHGGGISTHLPTLISLLQTFFGAASWVEFLHTWENVIFSLLVIIFMAIVAIVVYRKRERIPGRLQNGVEMLIETFADFIEGILGRDGRHFVPFLGTLFFYIWFMNLFGLIPLMKSPTSVFNTTIALAITVFLYVQYTGIRRLGIGGFLHHLAGEPRDAFGWGLVVIMFPLHVVGEFAKPLSLGLRLFGNVMGEDTLLAVFLGLGIMILSFLPLPVGLPLHLPFIFLAILTSTVQALVFTLLSTIYISQVLPHHEEDHQEA